MSSQEFIDFCALQHWFYGPSTLSFYQTLGPFTYFIQSGDTIKIGCSENPEKRVDQLRRGGKAERPSAGLIAEPRLLTYGLCGYVREQALHERFASSIDRGEWFFITDDLTALVTETIAEQARLEVILHNDWYQQAVKTHGWPPATFDLEAFIEKQVKAITEDLTWAEIATDNVMTENATNAARRITA